MQWRTSDLLIIRLAKVRAKYDRFGIIFQGVLDGFWQGSVNACCVHDDVRVLLVQWCVEVHIGEELICP